MNSRLTNPILRLNWAGWQSDTLTLQRCGWEISVEQDVQYQTIRIALQHREAQVQGISNVIDKINYMSIADSSYYGNSDFKSFPTINVHLAHRININLMEANFAFEPIDAEPRLITGEMQNIDDFKIFQPVQSKEIITDPEEVDQLMKRILELQSPKQRELREKQRRESVRMQKQVHAQVISLVA